jgi:isoleucyl-tRNA synthetase
LCDYPAGDASAIDQILSERMRLVRHIASLGRNARNDAQLKVRQPLSEVIVVLADQAHQSWLEEHAAVIADELNVKRMVFSDEPEKYVEHEVLPNFKLLGPRLGKLMSKIRPALARQSGSELLANIRDNGCINLTVDGQDVELLREEVEVRLKAREGWTASNALGVVVILSTELSEELVAEGLARDLVRAIQDVRKARDCQYTDIIHVEIETSSDPIAAAVVQFADYIKGETLANELRLGTMNGKEESTTVDIVGHQVTIHLTVDYHRNV